MNESTSKAPAAEALGRYPELVQTLEQSYTELEQALRGLDDNLCSAEPSPDSWSITEVIEHLGALEKRLTPVLAERLSASKAPTLSEGDQEKQDAELVAKVISRESKVPAPEGVCPTGRFTNYREALADFRAARQRTLAYVKVTGQDLKALSMPHPIFGPLNGHQWIQIIAGHTRRHIHQIDEIKETLLGSAA